MWNSNIDYVEVFAADRRREIRGIKRRMRNYEKKLARDEWRAQVLKWWPSLSSLRTANRGWKKHGECLRYPEFDPFFDQEYFSFPNSDAVIPQSGYEDVSQKDYDRGAVNRSRNSKKFNKTVEKFKSRPDKKKLTELRKDLHRDSKKTNPMPKGYMPESGIVEIEGIFGDHNNKVLNHLENFVALCVGLSESKSYVSVASHLFLYIKTISDKSVSKLLWEYICELFPFVGDDEIPDILPEGGVEIIDMLKGLNRNFKLLVNNPAFAKISYLMSACVCVGLCESSAVSWTLAGVRLFNPDMFMRHIRATDLIDALLTTVTYFVEGGYEFFTTGSLGGFLFSDTRIEKLQDDFNLLNSYSTYFRNGMLERSTGMSNHEYSGRLDDTLKGLRTLSKITSGAEKMVIDRMVTKIFELKAEFESSRVQGGSRIKPYTICLFGTSGVGKSTLTCALPHIMGLYNGYAADPNHVATLKADDKYQSNLHGDTTTIILEDVFNTHADFLQISPTENIVKISNNNPEYANKADVDSKGGVPIDPYTVIINTNIKDCGACVGSNEPASISRRIDVHAEQRVKPQFRISGGTALDWRAVQAYYPDGVPQFPDVWEFWVTDPTVVTNSTVGGKDLIKYVPLIVDECNKGKWVGIEEFLFFLKDHSRAHFAAQKALVEQTNTMHKNITLCPCCEKISVFCKCVPDVQGGFDILKGILDPWVQDWKTVAAATVMKTLSGTLISAVGYTPDIVLVWFIRAIVKFFRPNASVTPFSNRWLFYYTVLCIHVSLACFINFFILIYSGKSWRLNIPPTIILVLVWLYFKRWYRIVKRNQETYLDYIIKDRRALVDLVVKTVRTTRVQQILTSSAVLLAAYTAIQCYRRANKFRTMVHGNLEPENANDIVERDKEKSMWLKPVVSKVVFDRRLTTATMEQVISKVSSNLCYMRILESTGRYRVCDAFFVRTGVFVMPFHMLFADAAPHNNGVGDLFIKFQRRGPDCTGANFVATISDRSWVRVPNTDFIVVSVDAGGEMEDLTYLLTEDEYSGIATFIYRNSNGEVRTDPTTIKHRPDAYHKYCVFSGAEYILPGGTGPGLCMGTLVSNDKGKRIVGFHLGGKMPNFGVSGVLTKTQFNAALSLLSTDRIIPHASGEFPATSFGLTVLTSEEVDPHSPVNYLVESGAFNVYGKCSGGVTATSKVTKSLISDAVAGLMGVENTFGPPLLRPKWFPWRENFVKLANPSEGFSPDVVHWAKEDYLRPILSKIRENDFVREMIRPLTNMEVVNGIPNLRFVDKMTMNTSIGFPLSGPKTDYLVPLPPQGMYTEPVDFVQEVWDEVDRIEEALAKGERAYVIYKACIKDEPTSILKVKAPRIINSAPIGMQIVTRKYFLMLCRFMNMYPFLCESMVGINCMSPEWAQHRKTLTKDETLLDRCFAIDYSNYDHRMPAQMTFAVYDMFIKMCMASGNYSPRDEIIMRGIATEAAYPFVAFNGTLVSYGGSTISGTTLTVYQNNACNSLAQRCGYKQIELDRTGKDIPFRVAVHAGNYGDDNKGTVERWVQYYNMVSYQKYMDAHGMKVTMADKSADMVPFVHWDSADFLKRFDVYIPEIGQHVGALDEKSIFKSLHSNLRSKSLSREELAVACMTGAVHEFWGHGRTVCELRMSQLREVASLHGLDVPVLNKSFDELTQEWLDKYYPSVPQVTDLVED